ncbi:MAG: TonB-dependent receptor, partial [Bacteroidales bacterium]|nr:TonB-dependent receptor [Bacteroidales bacterium]
YMDFLKKFCLLLLITFGTVFYVCAQQTDYNKLVTSTTGVLVGGVCDANAKPLKAASVYVLYPKDSSLITYAITDANGQFVIDKIPFGHAFLKIEYFGYGTVYTQPFALSQTNPVYKIQRIKMSEEAEALEGVEIVAQVEMLENNLDKTVFNVESAITTEGATAVEVLEEIPSVDVDLDGNVTLRGSENVTILVDGKPTNLTLDQIPANLIQSIEVITNPSARLEPDGESGILNVVLKKRKESGFNGMVSLRGSMELFRNKPRLGSYSGSLSLNYSYDKINVFLNYDLRGHNHFNGGTTDRQSWFGEDTTRLFQQNYGKFGGYNHNLRTGLDWSINDKNTLSFTFSYNNNKNTSFSELSVHDDSVRMGEFLTYEDYFQTSGDEGKRNNYSGTINYKKTFETKGQELTADLYYTHNNRVQGDSTFQDYAFPYNHLDVTQRTTTIDNNTNASGQVDFVTPVGKKGRIETGYKLSYRSVGEDYRFYQGDDSTAVAMDPSRSNNFVFSEWINAAYFIYSTSFWDKLKVQAGLRGEIANMTSDLRSTGEVHKRNYYNLFPTVHVRYDITKEHSLQLSYSRRVSRPNIWQLNPFMNVADRQNYRCGNPDLQPEFVNSVELGYLMAIKKSSISATISYRQRNNIISRYTEILQDTIDGEEHTYTLTTYQNLKSSQNFGLELVYGQQLWKFWKISLSGSFYRLIVNSDEMIDDYLARDWTWRIRLNQTFTLPKDWAIQLNFRYRAPSITTGSMGWGSGGVGQGRQTGNYSLDLAMKKSFLNKALVVSLNIRNLVNSYKSNIETYSIRPNYGYYATSVRERGRLNISLSISYKINNYKKRVEKSLENNDYPEDMGE